MLEEEDAAGLGHDVEVAADHVLRVEGGGAAFELGVLVRFVEVEVHGIPGSFVVGCGEGAVFMCFGGSVSARGWGG